MQGTTFAANVPQAVSGNAGKDLFQKSAAISAKVNLATKSSLNSSAFSGVVDGGINVFSSTEFPGSDPFVVINSCLT